MTGWSDRQITGCHITIPSSPSFSPPTSDSFPNLDRPSIIFRPPSTCSWQLFFLRQLPAGKPNEASLQLALDYTPRLLQLPLPSPHLTSFSCHRLCFPVIPPSPWLQSTFSHSPPSWNWSLAGRCLYFSETLLTRDFWSSYNTNTLYLNAGGMPRCSLNSNM